MIFNKELDQILYLILKKDKKNRNDILKLLNDVPRELYKDVRYAFKTGDHNIITVKAYYNEENNTLYRISCTSDETEITIHEYKKYSNKYEESKILTISNYLGKLGSFINCDKPTYINNNDVFIEDIKSEYELLETPIMDIFVKKSDDEVIPLVRHCDLTKLPKTLSLVKLDKKFNYEK